MLLDFISDEWVIMQYVFNVDFMMVPLWAELTLKERMIVEWEGDYVSRPAQLHCPSRTEILYKMSNQ